MENLMEILDSWGINGKFACISFAWLCFCFGFFLVEKEKN
jgi:hypothetical protein